jgi:predicted nuclease of predicted toxin-antitoxin system
MKLLLDMNIPLRYLELLSDRGLNVVRWSEIGACDAEDTEIMNYARTNDYIILTCDLDFSAILSSTHERKPSIIQIRASIIHAQQAVELIAVALNKNAEDLEKGAILSIDMKNARLRLLPL